MNLILGLLMASATTLQPPCVITFVRHGQTNDNLSRNWGSPDSTPLNETGIEQINAIKDQFKEFDVVICSADEENTLIERTKMTAQILCPNAEIIPDPVIAEMRLGSFKDMTPEGIIKEFNNQTEYPNEKSREICPKVWEKLKGAPITDANDCYLDPWCKEADTFDGYYERFIARIKRISEIYAGQRVLIVGSSTGGKSCSAWIDGKIMANYRPLNGSYVVFSVTNGTPTRIKDYNIERK